MTSDSFSTSGQCCSLVISTRTLLPDASGEACSSSNTLSLANAGTCRYEDHFLEGNSRLLIQAICWTLSPPASAEQCNMGSYPLLEASALMCQLVREGMGANLMDIVQEQGAPVQLPEQARAALSAQKIVRPAHIQLRAVNLCHRLPPPGRPKVYQRRYLILLQARLPKDIHRLPAQIREVDIVSFPCP